MPRSLSFNLKRAADLPVLGSTTRVYRSASILDSRRSQHLLVYTVSFASLEVSWDASSLVFH